VSVSLSTHGTIVLEGDCPDADADLLLELLLSAPDADIDWQRCTGAHGAVLQVLMAAARPLRGPPDNAALARWVAPFRRGLS
jgi:hypothetical protein